MVAEIIEVENINIAIWNPFRAGRIPRWRVGLQDHMANSRGGYGVCKRVICDEVDSRSGRDVWVVAVEFPDIA